MGKEMKTVMTIAGSDSSGGAGIQADIKTITAHKLFATSAITAVTAQNTTGVYNIMEVTPENLDKQIECIFEDIYPDAVKIGMILNENLLNVIINDLEIYKPENVVIDTVMVSTSGRVLLEDGTLESFKKRLLSLATIITPNIPEAQILAKIRIRNSHDMEDATRIIANECKCNVLLKGGHSQDNADDLLYVNGKFMWLHGEKIENNNTHGTGCTLSSAIACNLAMGFSIEDSVVNAKEYISKAINEGLDLGKGNGPLDHISWINM